MIRRHPDRAAVPGVEPEADAVVAGVDPVRWGHRRPTRRYFPAALPPWAGGSVTLNHTGLLGGSIKPGAIQVIHLWICDTSRQPASRPNSPCEFPRVWCSQDWLVVATHADGRSAHYDCPVNESVGITRSVSNLKRDLLFFDRLQILGLDALIEGDGPHIDDALRADCLYLVGRGAIVAGPNTRSELLAAIDRRWAAEYASPSTEALRDAYQPGVDLISLPGVIRPQLTCLDREPSVRSARSRRTVSERRRALGGIR